MRICVNFGLQFIRGKMGICRNGKLQNQISRKRTKWEPNFGFWRKYQQNEVLLSVFWEQTLKWTLLFVIEKNNGGFCFRRKIAIAGFQFLKKNTILWVGQESPDRTKLKRAAVSNLKARTLCFVFSWSIFQRCLWKTCKIGNIHKTESLSWACKFFAVKWEFAEMGI